MEGGVSDMLQKTGMDSRPKRIRIDKLPEGGQYITLHDHEKQVDMPTAEGELPQKMWECDEVTFKLPSERVQTKENIESEFDSWWIYGTTWTSEMMTPPSLEQRISDIESALLALMGV